MLFRSQHPVLQAVFNDSKLNSACGLHVDDFRLLVIAFFRGFISGRNTTQLKLGKAMDTGGTFTLTFTTVQRGAEAHICYATLTWRQAGRTTSRKAWMRIWGQVKTAS